MEAGRTDKERLDFLDSLDCGHIEIWYYHGDPKCPQHDPHYGGHWAEVSSDLDPRHTLRDEVDWLMATPPEKWHHNAGGGPGPIESLKRWWQERSASRAALKAVESQQVANGTPGQEEKP